LDLEDERHRPVLAVEGRAEVARTEENPRRGLECTHGPSSSSGRARLTHGRVRWRPWPSASIRGAKVSIRGSIWRVKLEGRRIEIRTGTVRELRAATTRELRVAAVAVSRRAARTVGAPGGRLVRGFWLDAGSSQRPTTG
jgi:hypothetical protein